MGFLSSLFRSRDAPQNRTSGSAYSFFMGGSTSGKRVNERSSMQMTAVYSCVRVLSEAVAGLPLHLYKYTEEGSKEKATSHPLYFLLHDEPNPEMTSFVFRETLMTHLLLWGNAYAQIIRNGRQNGWMSANDIRELENLDRIPAELGGDLYLINGNMTKLADAGIFAGKASTENGEEESDENEEVLELEEPGGNGGTDAVPERHHRGGKLV